MAESSGKGDGILKNIRVLVVDDNAVLRFGLTGAMTLEDGLEAVGSAANSEEAMALCRELNPDVITMDYRLPGEDGISCTQRILAEYPEAKIILFSVFEAEEDIWNAVQAGVKGYLSKNARDVEDVMEAIHEVAAGETFFPASIAQRLEQWKRQAHLTPREMDVLRLLPEGNSNKMIADELGISLPMVKFHVGNIREKLGAQDRTQVVSMAYKRGLLHLHD